MCCGIIGAFVIGAFFGCGGCNCGCGYRRRCCCNRGCCNRGCCNRCGRC